jgi:hypothetical protein
VGVWPLRPAAYSMIWSARASNEGGIVSLRRLPVDEDVVGLAAKLTLPLGDEKLVAQSQTPAGISRLLLRHARLPRQAPEASDEGRVRNDRASYELGGRASTREQHGGTHPILPVQEQPIGDVAEPMTSAERATLPMES